MGRQGDEAAAVLGGQGKGLAKKHQDLVVRFRKKIKWRQQHWAGKEMWLGKQGLACTRT